MNINYSALRRRHPWITAYRAVSRRARAGRIARFRNADHGRKAAPKESVSEKAIRRLPRFDVVFLERMAIEFDACKAVTNIGRWMDKFEQLSAAIERGDGKYRQIQDHLFELQVISRLVRLGQAHDIVYEPSPMNPKGPNCDLAAEIDGNRYLIELKCIHPNWQDKSIPGDHIATNNMVIMDGPSYHGYEAGRDKLIEHSRAAERKFANYKKGYRCVLGLLVGFHLDVESLRDFVFIYRHGLARPDDFLGKMTLHALDRLGKFSGGVDEFWSLPFESEDFSLAGQPLSVGPLSRDDRIIKALS
jgi:hypothetical protein